MNVYYQSRATKFLDAKTAFIRGRGAKILADGIAAAVTEGNAYDRLNGRDRYGRPMVPVKIRTGIYRGKTGPPLAPSGAGSRVVANFRARATRRGGQWRVIAGWVDVVSARGIPFLPFHAIGSGRLPRRDAFGISPGTWAKIRPLIDTFKSKLKAVAA